MVQKAAAFAAKAHEGAFRKGTKVPYIVHPLETAVIVSLMGADGELVCAALLHDVVEDTPVTGEELRAQFGERVAALVMEETEDKSRSWKERKSRTVLHLKNASREVKMLVLADKLSNLRSIVKDYLLVGDDIWNRFHEKRKEEHAWYYREIGKTLGELDDFPAYQEYVKLCALVFEV